MIKVSIVPLLGLVALFLTGPGWFASGEVVVVVDGDMEGSSASAGPEKMFVTGRRPSSRKTDGGPEQWQRDLQTKRNCTLLNGEVVFEEYVLLEVVAIPALVTEQGLTAVAQAFVDAYKNTSICSSNGNGFRRVEEAEILPDAVDAFGDDYGLALGLQTGGNSEDLVPRNFTYLMVTRGRCNVCVDPVLLFSNVTSTTSKSRAMRRQLDDFNVEGTEDADKEEEASVADLAFTLKALARKSPSFRGISRTLQTEKKEMMDGALDRHHEDMGVSTSTSTSTGFRTSTTTSVRASTSLSTSKAKSKGKGMGGKGKGGGKKDCLCPPPTLKTFLPVYNSLIENATVTAEAATAASSNTRQAMIPSSDFVVVDIVQLQFIEGCDPANSTTFNLTIVLQVDTEVVNSPDFNVTKLEQDFLEAYNQANALNTGLCDLLFRRIIAVEADLTPFTFNRRRDLLSWLSSTEQQEEQEEETDAVPAPRALPSVMSPVPVPGRLLQSTPTRSSSFTPVPIRVTGACNNGCNPRNTRLTQDTSARSRRLNEQEPDESEIDVEAFPLQTPRLLQFQDNSSPLDCLCPQGAEIRGPTTEEVLKILATITNIPFNGLVQVTPVSCGVEATFTTTLTATLTIKEGATSTAKLELEGLVIDAYNAVAARLCDPYFRTITGASLQGDVVAGVDVNLKFLVTVRCRGCDGVDELFLDQFRRQMMEDAEDDARRKRRGRRDLQQTGECFCEIEAPPRGPTAIEFEDEFEKQVGSTLPNIFPPTELPSMAPTESPTESPTPAPTPKPTQRPTRKPTKTPTRKPTNKPTPKPSTRKPTTPKPSASPSMSPSDGFPNGCCLIVNACSGNELLSICLSSNFLSYSVAYAQACFFSCSIDGCLEDPDDSLASCATFPEGCCELVNQCPQEDVSYFTCLYDQASILGFSNSYGFKCSNECRASACESETDEVACAPTSPPTIGPTFSSAPSSDPTAAPTSTPSYRPTGAPF